MCDGLGIDELNLHDIAIAYICSMHILNCWRDDIKKGVSEGEDYVKYSNVLLPPAKTDAKKIAMKLVHFEKIAPDMLRSSTAKEEKSKEEKAAEITKSIIYSTTNMQPIAVTGYLSSSESETDDDESVSDMQSFDGTAVKTDTNTWLVVVKNQPPMMVTDDDLLDTNKFFVQGKWMSADDKAMKK